MKKLAFAIVILAAHAAAAQPSMTPPSSVPPGPPPPPPGAVAPAPAQPVRHGLTLGFDLGLGGMASGPDRSYTDCSGCQGQGAASLSMAVGAMVSPRAAIYLGLEIDAKDGAPPGSYDPVTHGQSAFLVEGAYWVSPRFWVGAGLGGAQLVDSREIEGSTQIDNGTALSGAAGYELIHGRRFALDARLRLMAVAYKNIGQTVTTPTIAIGLRWFGSK